MDKQISFYKDAVIAKRSKKISAKAFDFLLVGIISVLFYIVANLITESLPSVKATQESTATIQSEMKSLIKESKIGEEKDNSFVGVDTLSKNYIYRLTYASLLKNNVEEKNISSSISSLYEPITSENDNCYYYYVTFKETNLSSYNVTGIHGFTSYYNELSKDMPFTFYVIDNYPFLNLNEANSIQDYLVNSDSNYETGKNIYDALYNRYSSLLSDGVNDFQNNYLPYKEKLDINETYKNKIYSIRRIEILISYFLAIVVSYFVFPMLLKDGKSLAMKSLSLGYTDFNDNCPKFYSLIIHTCILFIEQSVLMAILPFIVYGANAIDLVYSPFCFDISLLWVGAFSLLFMLCSFITSFIDKEKKLTISELLSHLILKDGKNYNLKTQENNGNK